MRAMGSKSAAKQLMEHAKVPLVPGYHGDDQDPELLQSEANRIGYPVLLKASAGGGGKGMRVVERSEDFQAALASCKREAMSSFGDDKVLVIFNNSPQAREITFPIADTPLYGINRMRLIFGTAKASMKDNELFATVPALGVAIYSINTQ